jgi:hypothetical protein
MVYTALSIGIFPAVIVLRFAYRKIPVIIYYNDAGRKEDHVTY